MSKRTKDRKIPNIYWDMFTSFVKIGAFTIGGGYAMIPLIRREVVENKKWMDDDEFIDMLAMAQSAPGVIAVNTAIFVGYKVRGLRGSVVTTIGSSLTSFLVILLIAIFFTNFRDNAVADKMFKSIRPAVVALIVAPIYNMSKTAGITLKTAIIPILIAVLIWWLGVSPIWMVLGGIILGIAYGMYHSHHITKSS